jgi:hypothetical protein
MKLATIFLLCVFAAGCRTTDSLVTWRDVTPRITCQDKANAWLRNAYEKGLTNGLGRCFYYVDGEVKRGRAHVVPYYTNNDGERVYVEPSINKPIRLTAKERMVSHHLDGLVGEWIPIYDNGRACFIRFEH